MSNLLYRSILTTLNNKLPADLYPGADGWWALRKVRNSYTGFCIKIRRSSDNALQDIGFLSNGSLDIAAITSFVGSNSAYIHTWYDQSLNVRNFIMGSNVSQPRIVNAGTLEVQNGLPSIKFDGTDDYLGLALVHEIPVLNVDWATFIVQKRRIVGVRGAIFTGAGAANILAAQYNDNNFYGQYIPSTATNGAKYRSAADATATFCIIDAHVVSNSMTAYKNNSAYSLGAPLNFTSGITTVSLLGRYGNIGGTYSDCHISEVVHFTGDKTAQRAGLVSLLNSHYSIY